MIRIDYKIDNEKGVVNTTWVSEINDSHALIGRLVMTIHE